MGKGEGKIKVKGGKKGIGGSRWKKGDSCVSNPQIRKFRDAASSQYFHQVTTNSLLTVNNVEARNPLEDDTDEEDVLSADVRSLTMSDARSRGHSFSTYKTFASDWSKCSNAAFERFLSKFKLDSALHKDMLSILAATAEVINTLGGNHKETEYFASFITALDNCEPEQYPALTALFSIIIGKVPESVVKKKFSAIYPKIGFILSESIEADNHQLTRTCCDILKKIVGMQEPSLFEVEIPLQSLLYTILKCGLHENPKVRKKARTTIGRIMEQQTEKGGDVVQKLVLGWVRDHLSTYPTGGAKAAADSLNLMQFIWAYVATLSDSGAQKLYESVLRVMSSGENSIVKTGFSLFSTIFKKRLCITFEVSPGEFVTAKVVSAIWKFCPDWRNGESFISWLNCILDGLVVLADQNEEFTYGYIALLLDKISPTWDSSFGVVTTRVLCEYMDHIIKETIRIEHVEVYFKVISKNLISIPPNENCITTLSALLNTSLTPAHFCSSAREVLLQLIPLRLTTNEVGNVLGQFIKAFGLENLWGSVNQEVRTTILLPLVRDNLQSGRIQFWKENILPLAINDEQEALVWESFIGFCNSPKDPQIFPAEKLGKIIATQPKIRLTALTALRRFGMWSGNREAMKTHSKNYLPLLFNLYMKEKEGTLEAVRKKRDPEFVPSHNRGHADAVGVTIQEYLPFCEISQVFELIDVATTKLKNKTNPDDLERFPLLDLMAFLAATEIDTDTAEKLLNICSDFISDANHMKRVFRILTALVENISTTDEIIDKVCQILRITKGQTKSNAEPMRLNCINHIVPLNKMWMSEFLPEIILNLLSVNTRARKISLKIVKTVCESLVEKGTSIETFQDVVELGLKSGNAFIISCTIHFMTVIHREIRPPDCNESLIKECINHLLRKENSSITREALAFISLNLSLFKSRMGIFANSIGEVLATGGLPRKDMNRMLAKMIRIFGVAGLRAVLPNSNDPKMHTRIKNLQKKLRKLKDSKAQEKKGENQMEGENEGSDADEDVMDTLSMSTSNLKLKPSRGSRPQRLMIKEGVVDFLDPRDMTAALITKPKEVKPEDQFKFASDGRLIIEEASSKFERAKEDDIDDEELGLNYEDVLPRDSGSRKRKHPGGGGSVASSRRTKRSVKSTTSTVPSFVGSRKGSSKVIPTRTRVQAKRRKSNNSSASSKSKNSSRFK